MPGVRDEYIDRAAAQALVELRDTIGRRQVRFDRLNLGSRAPELGWRDTRHSRCSKKTIIAHRVAPEAFEQFR